MSWKRYVNDTSGGDVNRVIAQKLGITEPSVARWKSGDTKSPDAKQAAAFARAYGRPVLEAFVAAGFLTAAEAKERPTAAPALDSLSDDQLVEEIRDRLRRAGERGGDTPATRQPGAGPDNVTPLGLPPDADLDDLPAEADDPPPIGGGRRLPKAARRNDQD